MSPYDISPVNNGFNTERTSRVVLLKQNFTFQPIIIRFSVQFPIKIVHVPRSGTDVGGHLGVGLQEQASNHGQIHGHTVANALLLSADFIHEASCHCMDSLRLEEAQSRRYRLIKVW